MIVKLLWEQRRVNPCKLTFHRLSWYVQMWEFLQQLSEFLCTQPEFLLEAAAFCGYQLHMSRYQLEVKLEPLSSAMRCWVALDVSTLRTSTCSAGSTFRTWIHDQRNRICMQQLEEHLQNTSSSCWSYSQSSRTQHRSLWNTWATLASQQSETGKCSAVEKQHFCWLMICE